MASSSIEWTQKTWNPTVGCTKVSPGCKHCYAERQHARLTAMGQKKYAEPFRVVRPWTDDLGAPLRWKQPTRIFVNSMSDLFHEDLDDLYIAAVFGVMAACPQHTFQVLTKRAERMERWFRWRDDHDALDEYRYEMWRVCEQPAVEHVPNLPARGSLAPWPLPNVWLGISAENQATYDARWPHLWSVPAVIRFVSYEPALGALELRCGACGSDDNAHRAGDRGGCYGGFPDWVIAGGESGYGARRHFVHDTRQLVEQCQRASIPVFVKQMGANVIDRNDAGFDGADYPDGDNPDAGWCISNPCDQVEYDIDGHRDEYQGAPVRIRLRSRKGKDPEEWPVDLRVRQYPEVRGGSEVRR